MAMEEVCKILLGAATAVSSSAGGGGGDSDLSADVAELGEQVADIQSDVNTLKAKTYLILNGVPTSDPVTVGTTLSRTLLPQTKRIPATTADFSISTDGCGLICAKAGVVHIKKVVTVGTATTSNIYQTVYVNQAAIDDMAQTFIHEAGCLSIVCDFYVEVAANDEVCIMAETTQTEFMINYSNATVFAEYL